VSVTVAIDAMGGDVGVAATVPAALNTIKSRSDVNIILVGQEHVVRPQLEKGGSFPRDRIRIHHASQVVEMNESPAISMRKKKDSSLRVAINLVKEGVADACVSAGNTGALMATARFVLKTLPGIARPAIVTVIPTQFDHVHVLDLGANVDVPAEYLFQFGVMASTLVKHVENIERPRVALLNIGMEDIKGNETVKQAAELFRNSRLNYVGFREGDSIYTEDVDVIVCDGFVGNVALKASEGVAQMMSTAIRDEFSRNPLTKMAAVASMPILKAVRKRFDHRRYNGATLIGLNEIVIKSHGSADVYAFGFAIDTAIQEAETRLPQKLREELADMQEKGEL